MNSFCHLGRFHNFNIIKKYGCPGSTKFSRQKRVQFHRTPNINNLFDYSSIDHLYTLNHSRSKTSQNGYGSNFLGYLDTRFLLPNVICYKPCILLFYKLITVSLLVLELLYNIILLSFLEYALESNRINVFDFLSVFKQPSRFIKNVIRGFTPLYISSERQKLNSRITSKRFRERNKEKINLSNKKYYQKHKDVKKASKRKHSTDVNMETCKDTSENPLKRKHSTGVDKDESKNSRNKKNMESYKDQNHTKEFEKMLARIDKKFCKGTTIEDESTHLPNPDIQQANICVVCDRLIIGTEDVKKISKECLMKNEHCLSVSQYEQHFSLSLKYDLIEQYQVEDSDLHGLLLSPRAQSFCEGKHYQCCSSCYLSLKKSKNDEMSNPPKFSIANGFAIGHIPSVLKFKNKHGEQREKSIDTEKALDDIFSAAISPVRPFGYVHAYTGGSQKCITGHFSFFSVDQSHVGGVLNKYRNIKNVAKNIFIVLCGRMTPDQKRIIKTKVSVLTQTHNFKCHILFVKSYLSSICRPF